MNIIIQNDKLLPTDKELFFGSEDVIFINHEDFSQLLVENGVFKSKSQARKAGFVKIPKGFSTWRIGKYRFELVIFNPLE